jgi:hypothetical protein
MNRGAQSILAARFRAFGLSALLLGGCVAEEPDSTPGDAPRAASSLATVITSVAAVEDVSVRQAHPDDNYGADPLSAVSGPTAERHSYIKFVVADIPAGAAIVSARVELRVFPDGATPDGPRMYRSLTTSWSEGSMTWRTRPGYGGAVLDDLGAVVDGATVALDVTPAVTGNGTYSFTLVGDSTDPFHADSSEGAQGPVLVVTYGATGECPTGKDVRSLPVASVTRPPAGGSYIDPTFGTRVIRVTAANGSQSGYSYWGAFGTDKQLENGSVVKHFHVRDPGGVGQLYTIDTATDAITYVGPLFGGNVAGCSAEDAVWSHHPDEPHILYCRAAESRRVYRYDVEQDEFELVVDLAPYLTVDDRSLCQMSIDRHDDRFTFHTRAAEDCNNTGDDAVDRRRKAIAWDRSSGAPPYVRDYSQSGVVLNETQIDKNGRYVLVVREEDASGEPSYDRIDLASFGSPVVVTVRPDAGNLGIGYGHSTPGSGVLVNEDKWTRTGYNRYDLDDLSTAHPIVTYPPRDLLPGEPEDTDRRNWLQSHMSLNHADERYFFAETWTLSSEITWGPWQGEILAIGMDGSWVRRLAHHHGVVRVQSDGSKVYEDEPRASSSYDGRYVMFTSNFDGLGRDVYLLSLSPICQ